MGLAFAKPFTFAAAIDGYHFAFARRATVDAPLYASSLGQPLAHPCRRSLVGDPALMNIRSEEQALGSFRCLEELLGGVTS